MSEAYEKALAKKGLTKNILAYRSGVGSNIDHAKALFDEISSRENCVAIGVDISKFFDRIRHDFLLLAWKSILNVSRLPGDHFNVFESITRYSWVDKRELEKRLGRRIGPSATRRICSIVEFREKVRAPKPKLINPNKDGVGIPQGSPISGLLANLYLMAFDEKMAAFVAEIGGSYRRYSDDIAIVVPDKQHQLLLMTQLRECLFDLGLFINEKKTEVSEFSASSGKVIGNREFQYLGFLYDGQRVLIRSSSINRYYRKMTRAIKASIFAADRKEIARTSMYTRKLVRRYTHLGHGRNFVKYAYRAAEKMQSLAIRHQMRSHHKKFLLKLDDALKKRPLRRGRS